MTLKPKQIRYVFNPGDIVKSQWEYVLVTGTGNDNEAGYPSFAGVVVRKTLRESEFPVGTYSDTWATGAFKKVALKVMVRSIKNDLTRKENQ
jgi:hypothetical protein